MNGGAHDRHLASVNDVTIEVGQKIYGRLQDMKNKCSHVLAEFVDNALQSYKDHHQELESLKPDYKLKVEIDFWWGDEENPTIIIKDNAFGIDREHFVNAFKLANTPEDTSGLNEFGMGMKTAALWLGNKWELSSTAIGESVKRSVVFDLDEVQRDELKKLPVTEEVTEESDHFTNIKICRLTENAPSQKSLKRIKDDLSSLYRQQLKSSEMILIVNNEQLTYNDPEILVAPDAKNPSSAPVKWSKNIDFNFGKYSAKGFIAILKKIDSTKNGIVLLRRGRVIVGEDVNNRYFPKSLCGSVGTFRYKRIFGELELEGFDVTFNKNGIKETEDLEVLMEALREEIHQKNFDLYAQAEDYRLDEQAKQVKKIVRAHESSKAKDRRYAPTIDVSKIAQTSKPEMPVVEPASMGQYEDHFKVGETRYTMRVKFVNGMDNSDLLWIDSRQKENKILDCMINTSHPFFKVFKMEEATIAILKTFAMAKFTAQSEHKDIDEMFLCFNYFIKQMKV